MIRWKVSCEELTNVVHGHDKGISDSLTFIEQRKGE
jgi:hypothetical protein